MCVEYQLGDVSVAEIIRSDLTGLKMTHVNGSEIIKHGRTGRQNVNLVDIFPLHCHATGLDTFCLYVILDFDSLRTFVTW